MENTNFTITKAPKFLIPDVIKFLCQEDIVFDENSQYTCICYYNNKIIATGSIDNNVLKCIAVSENFKGFDISSKIISHLHNYAFSNNIRNLFIYTSPKNKDIFETLGFYEIISIKNKVLLMENSKNAFFNYLNDLSKQKVNNSNSGCVVVNCNPFTLGHLFLIETSAKLCEHLYIFVVYENKSVFPNYIRYNLVKENTKHIKNVTVYKASDYIISSATFPSYFIKDKKTVVDTHIELDLTLFSKFIAPTLNIKTRFVGEEPFCNVTNRYNDKMKDILPNYDINVKEIKRYEIDSQPISASLVRELIAKDEFSLVKKIVPNATYNFLLKDEAKSIIKNIKEVY
ncbi:MAG: [citrate (pro-3S)-lyase] ligase [Oscillospiraceae bacterium]